MIILLILGSGILQWESINPMLDPKPHGLQILRLTPWFVGDSTNDVKCLLIHPQFHEQTLHADIHFKRNPPIYGKNDDSEIHPSNVTTSLTYDDLTHRPSSNETYIQLYIYTYIHIHTCTYIHIRIIYVNTCTIWLFNIAMENHHF